MQDLPEQEYKWRPELGASPTPSHPLHSGLQGAYDACDQLVSYLPPPQTATPLGRLTQGRGPDWPWKLASGCLDREFLETLALKHSLKCTALQ